MKPAYTDRFLFTETKRLKERYNLHTLYETGSHVGLSSKILSTIFDKVCSVELNKEFYDAAVQNNLDTKNLDLHLGTSPEFLKSSLKEGDSQVAFFLDAHWGDDWPLLAELDVIAEKKLKPVIIIHDFFTPAVGNKSKFAYDVYKGTPLDHKYVVKAIEKIYGVDDYLHYCVDQSELGVGVGIYIPCDGDYEENA